MPRSHARPDITELDLTKDFDPFSPGGDLGHVGGNVKMTLAFQDSLCIIRALAQDIERIQQRRDGVYVTSGFDWSVRRDNATGLIRKLQRIQFRLGGRMTSDRYDDAKRKKMNRYRNKPWH